jgi:hypothetical protein
MRLWLIRAAAVCSAVFLSVSLVPVAAYASSNQICGNGGSGYCLNDWSAGGYGNPVKMYYGGYGNEDFYLQAVNRCGGDTVTTANGGCPFYNFNLDQEYKGDLIVQVVYGPKGLCIADTNISAKADLGDCASISSSGSYGAIQILYGDINCIGTLSPSGWITQGYLVDRYWSDVYDTTNTLTSGGNPGVQAKFADGLGTCWGNPNGL